MQADSELLQRGLCTLPLPAHTRISLLQAVEQFRGGQTLHLWRPDAFERMARLLVDALGCRQQVTQIIQEAGDYAHLSQLLDSLLVQCANSVSTELALAAQQCLMKDFSLQHESHLDIYSMWRAHHEKGNVR